MADIRNLTAYQLVDFEKSDRDEFNRQLNALDAFTRIIVMTRYVEGIGEAASGKYIVGGIESLAQAAGGTKFTTPSAPAATTPTTKPSTPSLYTNEALLTDLWGANDAAWATVEKVFGKKEGVTLGQYQEYIDKQLAETAEKGNLPGWYEGEYKPFGEETTTTPATTTAPATVSTEEAPPTTTVETWPDGTPKTPYEIEAGLLQPASAEYKTQEWYKEHFPAIFSQYPEAEQYIFTQLSSGEAPKNIINTLRTTGWTDQGFTDLYTKMATAIDPIHLTSEELLMSGIDLTTMLDEPEGWEGLYDPRTDTLTGLVTPEGEDKTFEQLAEEQIATSRAEWTMYQNEAKALYDAIHTVGMSPTERNMMLVSFFPEITDLGLTGSAAVDYAYKKLESIALMPDDEVFDLAASIVFRGSEDYEEILTLSPDEKATMISDMADEDAQGLVELLVEDVVKDENHRKYVEQILRYIGVDTGTIDNILFGADWERVVEQVRPYISKVYSTNDDQQIHNLAKFLFTETDTWLEQMNDIGWTQDRENLIRMVSPELSNEEVYEVFYGDYDKGWFGKLSDSILGGFEDLFGGITGGLQWVSQKVGSQTLEEFFADKSDWWEDEARDTMPVGQGIGWDFARSLPTTLYMCAAAGGVGGLAPTIGRLGTFGNYLLKTTGMGAVSRAIEATIETGQSYRDLIDTGLSKEEAAEKATAVFTGNMKLFGLDAVQYMFALAWFVRTGSSIMQSLIGRGIVRKGLSTVVGMGANALTEAGEEYYQQILQLRAMGEDIDTWAFQNNLSREDIRQVTLLGAMSGACFQSSAIVISTIKNTITNNAPPEFRDEVARYVREGMSRDEAFENAFKNNINDPAFQEIAQKSVEAGGNQFLANMIETSDEQVAENVTNSLKKNVEEAGLETPPSVEVIAIPVETAKVVDVSEWQQQPTEAVAEEAPVAEEQLTFDDETTTEYIEEVVEPTEIKTTLKPTEEQISQESGEEVDSGAVSLKKQRQSVMAWIKTKGFSSKQYKEIIRDALDAKQAKRLSNMNEEELAKVLDAVKNARPKKIKGKTVITRKTEKKIESLKRNLVNEKKMTEASFARIVQDLKLPATRYVSFNQFITESEGKSLIRAMNDQADWMKRVIERDEALSKNPKVKELYDRVHGDTSDAAIDGSPVSISRGNEFISMRYYMQNLQNKVKAPLYEQWEMINMQHLAKRQYERHLLERLEHSVSKQEFKEIINNPESLQRIEDFIAAKHKASGIQSPSNITDAEVRLATELERQLYQFRNDVRYARFLNAYAEQEGNVELMHNEIPSANKQSLRKAMDIYETEGATALRKYLDSQEWGVIDSGYNPLSMVKPHLRMWKNKMTSFGKGHIRTRVGNEYTQNDSNIIQRYHSYVRQLYGLVHMQPLIRNFANTYEQSMGNVEHAGHIGSIISRNLNMMKGYREDGGTFHYWAMRVYSLFASATFWQPYMPIRNLHQNIAFNKDTFRTFDPRNRKLTNQERLWFDIFVAQDKGLIQDYLIRGVKPLPGTDRLTRLANRTSLFPASDKINRLWAFWLRMNRAEGALKAYGRTGNVEKLMNESGANELTNLQKAEALEYLVKDKVDYDVEGMKPVSGHQAFALYVAQQHTNNVHFLYDRAQRAPAEQDPTGQIVGNILVFQRSWAERIALQAAKIKNGKTMAEKMDGMTNVVYVIAAGLLAGMLFGKITGKEKYNPYNVMGILTWSPGGLLLGSAQQVSETIYNMVAAVQGDKTAISALPQLISGTAKLGLPFYKAVIQVLDSAMDKKYIDVEAMRMIRELIDDNYERHGGAYQVERDLLEILQHAIFGAVTPSKPKAEDSSELDGLLSTLGKTDDDNEDLIWSSEDPEIIGLADIDTDIRNILKDYGTNEITSGDYPDIIKAWADKEPIRKIYDQLPKQPLFKYKNIYDSTIVSQRSLELLEEYHDPSTTDEERERILVEHPELTMDMAENYLIQNPEENAKLFLWGDVTQLYTKDSYDNLIRMMEELDIPDSWVQGLPPIKIAPDYFDYQDKIREFPSSSHEVTLWKMEHPDYTQWKINEGDWQEIDTHGMSDENFIKYLTLEIDNKEMDELYENMEPEEGKTLEETHHDWLAKDENSDYHQSRLTRDWLKKEEDTTNYLRDNKVELPKDYDLEKVFYQYKQDVFDTGSGSSAEVKLLRLEDDVFNQWGLGIGMFLNDITMPSMELENGENITMVESDYIKRLEIDVEYRDLDDKIEAIKEMTWLNDDQKENNIQAILIENPTYAHDCIVREGLKKYLPMDMIPTYVEWVESGLNKNSNVGKAWLRKHSDWFYHVCDNGQMVYQILNWSDNIKSSGSSTIVSGSGVSGGLPGATLY